MEEKYKKNYTYFFKSTFLNCFRDVFFYVFLSFILCVLYYCINYVVFNLLCIFINRLSKF